MADIIVANGRGGMLVHGADIINPAVELPPEPPPVPEQQGSEDYSYIDVSNAQYYICKDLEVFGYIS